jgi:hypothetical protein
MPSESVCQVSCSWVDVGSFHKHVFGVVYVICGDFQNGSEKGTVSVHQILCQSWEKCCGALTMIQQAFGDQILSRTQVFQWHAWFKTGHTLVDNDTQADPQPAKLLKLLLEFQSSSIRIEVGSFTALLRRWELVMRHANRF